MTEDNISYLFIDKYDGDHTFSNKRTIGITIQNLFESDMKQIEGKEALDEYNKFIGVHRFENFNNDIYKVLMFINGSAKYTILTVNNNLIKQYIVDRKINEIPNYEDLLTIVRFHICYKNATLSNGQLLTKQTVKPEGIICDIIKQVLSKTGDIIDPMVDNPDFLNVQLFPYQKRSIKWMYDREKNLKHVSFNMNQEISFGDFYYDVMKQTFLLNDNRKNLIFRGGALCEEVGLGKTIEMLTLSLLNQSDKTSYYEKDSKKLHSRATLIICPNQLCGQWKREFDKMIKKDYDIKVISILTKVHFDKYSYQDILDADFVIVSLSFLDNNSFIQKTLKKFVDISKTYHRNKPELFNMQAVKISLDEMGSKLVSDPELLYEENVILPLIKWHRIIVDEFHELYTVQKYSYMINLLPLFTATYKWCVTGTPFDKDVSCLTKMVDFVTDYTNTHGEKVFTNNIIEEYMKNMFFRRNTKKSVNSEYQLPPLKEQIVWLKFTPTERMMYNAYLANPNIDKYSVLIRQICCDPKLAEETKNALSNCKTLEDIEKVLVKHYQNEMDNAKTKYEYSILRKKLIKVRYEKAVKRQWRHLLNQLDYDVEIEDNGEEDILLKEISKYSKYNFIEEEQQILDDNEQEDKKEIKKRKKKIIIGYDNYNQIKEIIGNKQTQFGAQTIANFTNLLQNCDFKEQNFQKQYEGKKATYEFFNNVITKIRSKTNKEKDGDEEDEDMCTICLGEIPENDIGVTKCGHMYCYNCVKSYISKKHECPLCKAKVLDDQLYMISYVKEKKNIEECKDIKEKQELINQVGTKIANLIYFLKNTDKHTILFSQWDDLLRRVGDYLEMYGIKTAYCKGNVWQRDKAIRLFNTDSSYKVIMLSSESAASGTNLTRAQQVILLDPVSGSYEYRRNTEWQAIGRAHRMGQMCEVSVVRFIIKDTIEEEIYKENIKEDTKHKQQFKIFETEDDSIVLDKDKIITKVEAKKKATKKMSKDIKDVSKKMGKVRIVDDDFSGSEQDSDLDD